jgi:UDP-2,3-diacylglucosamine pyrophosphatase LpxH
MPDIRYVCLSDTHFGADNSVLTYLGHGRLSADPMRQSPVLEQLVLGLRDLVAKNERGEKPSLVLNGDILELALTTDNRAAMAFERFLELAFPKGGEALFRNRIYYLPGNHDHHLWETAREAQYLEYIASEKTSRPIDPPWHATNLFLENRPKPCPANFLDTLARRHGLADVSFITAYPNLGLVSGDDRRAVIFTHGHFAESIYTLVTRLMTMLFPDRLQPTQVWEVEAENFAWIDFFWSALGRSGQAGENIEIIYDKLQDKAAFSRLLQNLARVLAQHPKVPGWGERMKVWLLYRVLGATMGRLANAEVQRKDVQLSEDAEAALKRYLEGPLRAQVLSERPSVPAEVTVVFGHTHKPFERVTHYQGFAEDVKLLNSGGWVVDSVDAKAPVGWAVVLLDEDLNAASLRFPSRIAAGANPICVAKAEGSAALPNPFHERLVGLVDAAKPPWSNFLEALRSSVADHLENLKLKISSPT